MDSTVKIGLIGLGHIAGEQVKALSNVNQFQITSVCDLDKNKEKQVHLEKIPFYNDYHELLNTNINAVLISTPNLTHYEICKNALLAGKNVLLEKPAVPNRELLLELKEIAEEKGVLLTIAYHASFAKDLLGFLKEYEESWKHSFGPMTGFQCQFYDPYLIDGSLLPKATTLQGSWIDSGINALSVVERLLPIQHLNITDSRLSKIKGFPCEEVQGTVDFHFPINGGEKTGRGQIDTNWTLGKNSKLTKLFFDETNSSIILDHSKQQIIKVNTDQTETIIKDYSNENTRLVNHYIGVFHDFYDHLNFGTDNLFKSFRLHQLLYTPYL